MLYQEPTVYNAPNVYKQQGGGGIGLKEIGGITYPYVKINNLYWFIANLKWRDNNIPIGGGDYNNTPHVWFYDLNDIYYKYSLRGFLYNNYAVDYIVNNIDFGDGWRIPTHDDCLDLGTVSNKLKSQEWDGNNELLFNGIPSGARYPSANPRYQDIDTEFLMYNQKKTGTVFELFELKTGVNTAYMFNSIDNGAYSIRLCKDA